MEKRSEATTTTTTQTDRQTNTFCNKGRRKKNIYYVAAASPPPSANGLLVGNALRKLRFQNENKGIRNAQMNNAHNQRMQQ